VDSQSRRQPIQRTVRTPDGRVLAVEDAGDPHGLPVLVHNGTPNSRHLYAPNVADAAAPSEAMPMVAEIFSRPR